MRRVLGVLVLTLVVAGLVPQPAQAEHRPPTRIMLIGDSVTHGAVGDYTWRYRLWGLLKARRANVDFVGPARGVYNTQTSSDDPSGYADPNFDHDHAAWVGETMMFPHWPFGQLMTDYRPDVVVNALGINDLCFVTDPDGLIAEMIWFVENVRAVRPHVAIILGQLPQHWLCNVDEYNAKLAQIATSLDRPDARVIAAQATPDFTEYVDTRDTRHLSASGEVKLASEYYTAINETLRAAELGAHIHGRKVTLSWTIPAGTIRQRIYFRHAGAHHWRLLREPSPNRAEVTVRLRHHQRYEFRIKEGGRTVSRWSSPMTLRTH